MSTANKPKSPQSPEITTAEAARIIGISERCVRFAIAAGKIAAHRAGKNYVVNRLSAEHYAHDRRKNGAE